MDLSKHLFFNEKFTLLLEKNMPKLESFKTLRCGLKFVSPRHKILSISCRYFNCDTENEWTQKKVYSCGKDTRDGITLFQIIKSQLGLSKHL